MAVLWSKNDNGTNYRVTRAGNTVRLYRNGVLHSQWNPLNPIKGHIWELFLLSSLARNEQVRRVLVLGVGGGAVINLVHHFFGNAYVEAVDLDDQHLSVAKKHFKIDLKRCRLVLDDAKDWALRQASDQYDLVIDDLFAEKKGIPYRAVKADYAWIDSLLLLLQKTGTLVMNFADKNEWNKSKEKLINKPIHQKYHAGVIQHKNCDNNIIHLSREKLTAEMLRDKLNIDNGYSYLKCWQAGYFSYRSLW